MARRTPQAWRDQVEVVAMDGFTGFKTATTEELPDAVAVMDPSRSDFVHPLAQPIELNTLIFDSLALSLDWSSSRRSEAT